MPQKKLLGQNDHWQRGGHQNRLIKEDKKQADLYTMIGCASGYQQGYFRYGEMDRSHR